MELDDLPILDVGRNLIEVIRLDSCSEVRLLQVLRLHPVLILDLLGVVMSDGLHLAGALEAAAFVVPEDPGLVELLGLPDVRRRLAPKPPGSGKQLGPGVAPVLVHHEVVLMSRPTLWSRPCAQEHLRVFVGRGPSEEVTVVHVGPALHVAFLLLTSLLALLLGVNVPHLRRLVFQDLRALLLVGSVSVRLDVFVRGRHRLLRVAVPHEVVRHEPVATVVDLFRGDLGSQATKHVGRKLLLPNHRCVYPRLIINVLNIAENGLLLSRLGGRRREVAGRQNLGTKELLLPPASCDVVLLGDKRFRHGPQILLVVVAKHLGRRLISALPCRNEGRLALGGGRLEDRGRERRVVA
mmetsp:Transcript_55287/g.103694  ORF Transcript_55287/g.103694 Transcript_55287/m.103694 type:complete len:352 (+) Transcript_55287:279-1334(+)